MTFSSHRSRGMIYMLRSTPWWKDTMSSTNFPPGAILHLFETLFLISWENNRDCHITMPLSLKTMEVQIKEDQWNKRFRTVQVYWYFRPEVDTCLTTSLQMVPLKLNWKMAVYGDSINITWHSMSDPPSPNHLDVSTSISFQSEKTKPLIQPTKS